MAGGEGLRTSLRRPSAQARSPKGGAVPLAELILSGKIKDGDQL